eukprot:5803441-Amphidinium_carterae.1
MGTPEVRCTMMLVMQAILSKHGSQAKQGAAPRNPPARAVLKTLTEMGEWTEQEGTEVPV